MVRKPLLLTIYSAASMQRWNDQIRPAELTELDKQAHKMIIAFVLAKLEKDQEQVNWLSIIESGLFEFLQRIVLTDLKPPLFHRIKKDRQKYLRLNEWVYSRIEPIILPLGKEFCSKFKQYLLSAEKDKHRRIISAAHFYATKWEFDIIARANPRGHLIEEIEKDIHAKQEQYNDLQSMQKLLKDRNLTNFVNICGQLRFQVRWSHLHRVPKTSVLGHMLIVAVFSYLLSLEIGSSVQRGVNNYLTGLFHDLPEVLTRDIINPVKRSIEGLKDLINEYEREEMEKRIYKLLPPDWHAQMRMYTENEFSNIINHDGEVLRDGEMIKAADDLAAFIEIQLAFKNGIKSESLDRAKYDLLRKYKPLTISGINFGQIYADFD